jgi:hypothetical protein
MTKTKTSIFAALAMMAAFATSASARESPPSAQQHCPIDTTKDANTGSPRNGVSVCYDDHSASVGVSTNSKEIEHFLKYPIGQSDKSVAKQVGNAVHNFFHHL